jgi:RPA family protein
MSSDTTPNGSSENGDSGDNGSRKSRKPANYLLAHEFNDCTLQYKESDADMAPNWAVFPTGLKANRVFVTGTLMEVVVHNEDSEEKSKVVTAKINDTTSGGNYIVNAVTEHTPDPAFNLEDNLEPPVPVSVVGKIRVTEGEDEVFQSIKPESVNEISTEERDVGLLHAAEHSLKRAAKFNGNQDLDIALDGAAEAREEYGADVSEYHENAVEVLESLRDR